MLELLSHNCKEKASFFLIVFFNLLIVCQKLLIERYNSMGIGSFYYPGYNQIYTTQYGDNRTYYDLKNSRFLIIYEPSKLKWGLKCLADTSSGSRPWQWTYFADCPIFPDTAVHRTMDWSLVYTDKISVDPIFSVRLKNKNGYFLHVSFGYYFGCFYGEKDKGPAVHPDDRTTYFSFTKRYGVCIVREYECSCVDPVTKRSKSCPKIGWEYCNEPNHTRTRDHYMDNDDTEQRYIDEL
ncbi:hypothetical protein X973_12680 [Piscirickettsia salmonis]|nr:hypothetical protein X973_12680 [Piscirickettsia salmonis]WGZ71634.1 hypothetical protein E3220_08335 [Piscirickettsia salmonis EM-90]